MYTVNIRNKFHIYCYKIVLLLALVFAEVPAQAQLFANLFNKHNLDYDKRKFSYGFQIGLHGTSYLVNHSDEYVSPLLDTLHSVVGPVKVGFTFGFLVNMRLNEFFDLRLMPQATFYDFELVYRYTNNTSVSQLIEATLLETPLLVKYKSIRRGNYLMYMLGGVTPSFQLSGRRAAESTSATLPVSKTNLSITTGLGFDIYYPLFKLSIELRFNKGLLNMLKERKSDFAVPISKLSTNTLAVYFIFQ